MRNGWGVACWVGLAGASSTVAALAGTAHEATAQDSEQVAPDERRGLGEGTTLQELQKLLRSDREADRSFLAGLFALEGELRIQMGLLRESYRARGWFEHLGPRADQDLESLHVAYRATRGRETQALSRPGRSGEVYAEMLCDTRFNVRCALLEHFERDAREVRTGLAVLRASGESWTTLLPEETQAICARVDLSSSLLRALRSDLLAMRPTSASEPSGAGRKSLPDAYAELREIPRVQEAAAREEALKRVLAALRVQEERMKSALFTTRLLPRVKSLLAWRDQQLGQAETLRIEALSSLPDSVEGRAATGGIEKLGKSDRMRAAQAKSLQGLAFDPLDEDLAWAAAHSIDFQWGSPRSRPYYDRFLALRGIRPSDDRTYRDRKLDARELEALAVVQRSPAH